MVDNLKKKNKPNSLPEWATQITALREHLTINQAELARRMECSAMTISRWERGLLQPSAEHFIQLGNLGDRLGLGFSGKSGSSRQRWPTRSAAVPVKSRPDAPGLELVRSGPVASLDQKLPQVIGVPLLKGVVGAHGADGDHRSLRTMPLAEMVGVPASWCPNPAYTSLLRVKGHSMEPLIRQGDLIAVDSFQTERDQALWKDRDRFQPRPWLNRVPPPPL